MGNSNGTADVEYVNPEDAAKAIKEYNGAEFDGFELIVGYKSGKKPDELKSSTVPGFTLVFMII